MEQEKIGGWISENMASIFGYALSRLGDRHEAEDLAGDIMAAMLRSAHRIADESRMNAYMWRIAHNVYVARIRSRRDMDELPDDVADDMPTPEEALIHSEDIQLLRRELMLLSEQYRRATVMYYMENLTCPEISARLGIGTEMVKYYLFRARRIIREGMNMERIFGEKSYNPQLFEIDFWGTRGGSSREYKRFGERKLAGNILLAAYYSRVTAQELAMELGVALPYLEDELRILTELGYLKEMGGKYLTCVPIFTAECTAEIRRRMGEASKRAMDEYMTASTDFSAELGGRFADENLLRWQEYMLCCHVALKRTAGLLDERYGGLPSDGIYRRIMGGDGIMWGRCSSSGEEIEHGLQGIYNGGPSRDGRSSVIAFNFNQTMNAQHFCGGMEEALSSAVFGGELPDWMERDGWTVAGKPNFAVYTAEEYGRLEPLLSPRADILTGLMERICEIAAAVTAELAPEHIRREAEYAGAMVYRFNGIDSAVACLYGGGWLKAVDDKQKPAVCLVRLK